MVNSACFVENVLHSLHFEQSILYSVLPLSFTSTSEEAEANDFYSPATSKGTSTEEIKTPFINKIIVIPNFFDYSSLRLIAVEG